MEPRSGTRRKIKPRCIVNYSTSRRPASDAYAQVNEAKKRSEKRMRVRQQRKEDRDGNA